MTNIRIDTHQVKRDIQKHFKENNIDCNIDNWQFEYDQDNNLLYNLKGEVEEQSLANFIDFIGSIDYLREISTICQVILKQSK